MKKSTVIEQTLATAAMAIVTLEGGGVPNRNGVDKWSEALLRYVLNDNQGNYNPNPPQRTHAQRIENLQYQFDNLEINQGSATEAIQILNNFIAAVHDATDTMTNLGVEIIWEPIFDRN